MGEAVTPTSRDPYLAKLEEANILKFLRSGQEVLEVGCGDASHTAFYAKCVKHVTGLDISRSLLKIAEARGIDNARWVASSVLDLKTLFPQGCFDLVVSQRCLISLPSWKLQRSAIHQIHGVLREGGLFMLTEGFQEPLNEINAVRNSLGLSGIQVADYNVNLPKAKFETLIRRNFKIVYRGHYGLYLLLSRVYHPLLVHPDEPEHGSKINEAAMKLSASTDGYGFYRYSYNLFYVLKKGGEG